MDTIWIFLVVFILWLLAVGFVQSIRMVIWLVTGARSRKAERIPTAAHLGRLREQGYITPEAYEQVMQGLAAALAKMAPPIARQQPAVSSQPQAAGVRVSFSGSRPVTPGIAAPPLPPFLQRPAAPPAPPPLPKPPAPIRGDPFASFLERRNIRWGELLGGLLILGCSSALVVSFWAQIADRPIFKFALFTLATAAFFGIGLYTEHRWKLPTTSRAILILATLLVPVNLLAIAALGGSGVAVRTGTLSLAAQLASLAIFTALSWPAAKVLAGELAGILTAGLSAASLSLIIITTCHGSNHALAPLAAMPAGCLIVAAAILIRRLWKMQSIDLAEAISVYLPLGVIGFAAWLAVGFLLFTAPQTHAAARELSSIITAMGLPAFFMGLVIWKRASHAVPWYAGGGQGRGQERSDFPNAAHAGDPFPHPCSPPEYQGRKNGPPADSRVGISALALAIFGTAILLAGLVAAWPGAGELAAQGAFAAVLLTATAVAFDLPAAYVPAALLASLSWLVGFHCWPISGHRIADDSVAILAALRAGENGWLLLPMAIVLGLGAQLADLKRRPTHSAVLGALAVVTTAASVWLANAAFVTGAVGTELDPASFDLLVGAGFLFLWTAGIGDKRLSAIGAITALLLCEWLTFYWPGSATDELVRCLVPTLPIALCFAVPAAVWLICMRRNIRITAGLVAVVGLIETVAIALAFRWHRPGDVGALLAILRFGHVMSAWAVFGLGVWARRRFDVAQPPSAVARSGGIAEESQPGAAVPHFASESRAAQPGGAVSHETPAWNVEQTVLWTLLSGLLGFIVCLLGDGRLSWGADGMFALCMLVGWLACWADRPGLLFVAGILLNIGGTYALQAPPLSGLVTMAQLPMANVLLLAIGGGGALILDRLVFEPRRRRIVGNEVIFHCWASWAALALLAATWAVQRMHLIPRPGHADALAWTALAAVAALFAARLRRPGMLDPIVGMYFTGLLGIAFVLADAPAAWGPPMAVWCAALGLYGLASAVAGSAAARVLSPGDPRRRFLIVWLRIGSAALAAWAVWGALYCDWSNQPMRVRMVGAVVALAQGVGLALLAEEDLGTQGWALAAVAIGMVAIAWAVLPVAYLGRGLDMASAAIGALAVFAAGAAGCGKIVAEKWRSAIRAALVVAASVAAIGTLAVVVSEASDCLAGNAPVISGWAVIGIECELLLGCTLAVVAAMGKWPIVWTGRSACAWSAEALAGLAFVHLRITEPWMFSARVELYWPMILLAMAFGLLGGGFAMNRRGRGEIGRPMVYSGIGWPMAAIFVYWLHPTAAVDYSAVLWLAGLLYGMVAVVKRSPGFTLLAAACLNGALWVIFFRHPELAFLNHPQLWLIPMALSVHGAAEMYHRQLSVAQLRSVRYLCLAVIYLSSTADILLNGVMVAPWLPMVLAALAIAGVLAGIMWHIRPFLYLGTTFLLIAVLTMIWTAQMNWHWTWLWYVAGLVVGVTLFTVFGLFEKRHVQMTRMLAGLRQWQ